MASRQVMQRDPHAPAVGSGPDDKEHRDDDQPHPERKMRSDHAQVNRGDQDSNGKSIADDRKRPGIAGIAFVDKTAVRAAVKVRGPS